MLKYVIYKLIYIDISITHVSIWMEGLCFEFSVGFNHDAEPTYKK